MNTSGELLQYLAARAYRDAIENDDIKINQGRILAEMNRGKTSRNLADYEFKVFSQWGEDGILQRLVERIPLAERTFIEFGVEDFSESNCRFLMMKDNWRGFVIDGSERNVAAIRSAYYYWRYDLTAVSAFITRENIDDLLARSGFGEDLGILSVDIDGNDYHVWEAISGFRPRIVICEYNAVFGAERKISVPYHPRFQRTVKHHSNLYFGASLAALAYLGRRKGYTLVGTGSAGANAFFVRDDLMTGDFAALTPEAAYHPSRFRESRDAEGQLTFVGGEDRLALIAGMPVIDVETGEMGEL